MVKKKGYFFILETLLVVIILTIALFTFPESERKHLEYEEIENMKGRGYGSLFALDKQGIFKDYFSINVTESNFSIISEHIESSIDSNRIKKIEYIYSDPSDYNSILCLNSSGQSTSCGEFVKSPRQVVTATLYSFSRCSEPVTIRLYLGGQL